MNRLLVQPFAWGAIKRALQTPQMQDRVAWLSCFVAVTAPQDAVTRAIPAENPALCVVAFRPESTELVRRLADQLRMSVFLIK